MGFGTADRAHEPAREGREDLSAFFERVDYPFFVVTVRSQTAEMSGCLAGFVTQCSIHPAEFPRVHLEGEPHARRRRALVGDGAPPAWGGPGRPGPLFGEETGDQVDKFASVDWRLGSTGAPLLVDSAVSMEGEILGHFSVGDHEAFLVRGVPRRWRAGMPGSSPTAAPRRCTPATRLSGPSPLQVSGCMEASSSSSRSLDSMIPPSMPLATCMSRASTELCRFVEREHGAALDRLEHQRLDGLVLGRALADERRHPAVRRVELEELAVEGELHPVRGALHDPPRAADAEVAPRTRTPRGAAGRTSGAGTRPRCTARYTSSGGALKNRRTLMIGSPAGVVICVVGAGHGHVPSPLCRLCVLVLVARLFDPVVGSRCSSSSSSSRRSKLSSQNSRYEPDPVRELLQPLRLEVAHAPARQTVPRDQAGPSSTRRCLVMAGWLMGNGCGHVEHAGVALRQAGQDRPPRRVRERAESPVELDSLELHGRRHWHNHMVI